MWPPPSITLYIYEMIERNNLLDTIPTWGPLFSISFDLIINSYGSSSSWLTILSFRANNSSSNYGNFGDRIPAMHLNGGKLYFENAVGENPNYHFNERILPRKWYNIQVNQKLVLGKVLYQLYSSIFTRFIAGYLFCIDGWRRDSQC